MNSYIVIVIDICIDIIYVIDYLVRYLNQSLLDILTLGYLGTYLCCGLANFICVASSILL